MVNETDGAAANVQKHLKEELRKSIESFSLRTIAGVRVADLRVPQLFWSLLPRIDRYAYAATLRDDLYWDQDGTRRQTGDILLAAMKETDVTSVTRAVICGGIRTDSPPVWLTFRDRSRDWGTIFLRHHYRPKFAIAECFASKTRPGDRVFAPVP